MSTSHRSPKTTGFGIDEYISTGHLVASAQDPRGLLRRSHRSRTWSRRLVAANTMSVPDSAQHSIR
eukprot:3133192-Rhodomonas_salina.1